MPHSAASAHFPAMTAAAVAWRPGACRPSRRVHWMVVTRRRQQGSGIGNGSRFGKLFLVSNLSDGWAEGTFLLLQVSVAVTGLTGANYGQCCRLSREYGNIGNIVCIIYFFIFLLKLQRFLQAIIILL